MAFTARGLRLSKSLENYVKEKSMFFDTSSVLNKITLTAATDDVMRATFTVDSSMCNGTEHLHGGFTASVIDVVCLYANLAKTNAGMALTTNMNINYISRAAKGEKILTEATTLKGGNYPIMEALMYKENGVIIAKGTVSFRVGNEQFQKLCSEILTFDIMKKD